MINNQEKKNVEALRIATMSGLIRQCRIGIRNVVVAEKQVVMNYGLDVETPSRKIFIPEDIAREPHPRSAYVEYAGGRARLVAAPWCAMLDQRRHRASEPYIRNDLADELFKGALTRRDSGPRVPGAPYGDALLITSIRAHWLINPNLTIEAGAADEVSSLLEVDHEIILLNGSKLAVLLLERPAEDDLVALRLRAGENLR